MAGPGMLSLSRTEKYCTKLADDVMKLRSEKALMDFRIHSKDDEFPCTKFVMAAHSPMLRAMLTSDMTEVAKQEIRLDHISKDVIQIILDYMYCEDVSFHKDQLMDLLAASDYLQMSELKEICLDEVPGILEPGSVIEWWKEAMKMNYDNINLKSEEIMVANVQKISHQTDFLNLDLNEMQHYVSEICCDIIRSDDIIDAAMRWVTHAEDRVTLLEDILHKVNLSKCSREGITSVIKTHEALLDKAPMVYKLLINTLSNIEIATSRTVTDSVVLVGGQEGDEFSHVCWTVEKSNEIVHLCDIPIDIKVRLSVCETPQGFVVTGGRDSVMCMMLIATTKSWIRLQDLLQERRCHGSACVKEVLYVLGGYLGEYCEDDKPSDSVDSMIMKEGVWACRSNLPLGVKFPKVSNCDESLYLLDVERSKQLLRLDVTADAWHELPSLPVEQSCHGVSMTSANRRLLVAGGENMICAWFNVDTNTWSTGTQPLRKHEYGSLTHYNGKFLLFGGHYINGTDEVEMYDREEDNWTLCTYKMPRKLRQHFALSLKI